MAKTAQIEVKDRDVSGALREFFKTILGDGQISAILVPWRLAPKKTVMPTLITDPKLLEDADPLSPCFAINAARIVSRLTRKSSGEKIAAVLRPCEIRAVVELVKLKQARTDDLVIIGIDCLGAMPNRAFLSWVGQAGDDPTRAFCSQALGDAAAGAASSDLAAACKACQYPVATGADIAIGLFGVETTSRLLVQGLTAAGENLLAGLKLSAAEEPPARAKAIEKRVSEATAFCDAMFARTRAATDNLAKLTAYFAGCINCYNCRVACPVCYCRECVFVTDVFDHEPSQYLGWARRKGAVKMPTDTVFYHLTRMAHMSTACVGCGQCSNACPSDIDLMALFRSVADRTQAAFDYIAGRSLTEKPPLTEFRENEFTDIVGMH
jgi:formate dehydrogenase subunit beta